MTNSITTANHVNVSLLQTMFDFNYSLHHINSFILFPKSSLVISILQIPMANEWTVFLYLQYCLLTQVTIKTIFFTLKHSISMIWKGIISTRWIMNVYIHIRDYFSKCNHQGGTSLQTKKQAVLISVPWCSNCTMWSCRQVCISIHWIV